MSEPVDLGYRKINRSAYAAETGRPLDIFLGTCETHDRPVRHEGSAGAAGHGKYWIPCPEGGHLLQAERLVAVTSQVACDGACMSARRPSCDCGCGGMNHGKSWGTTVTSKQFESALLTYRAAKQKVEEKRVQRAEARERKARQDFETWAADHAELLTALQAHVPDEMGYPQEGSNDFLCDLARQVHRSGKILTDNQVAAGERTIAREQARQVELAARKAAAKPVPVGKVQLSGEIVKITCREGYMSGSVEMKAIVSCDGYAVWMTLPRKVEDWAMENRREELWKGWTARSSYETDYDGASTRWTNALKGVRLSCTATVTCSDRDPSFGFAKRPTQATIQVPEPELEAGA